MQYYIGNLLVTVYSWDDYVKLKKQKYERAIQQTGQSDKDKSVPKSRM